MEQRSIMERAFELARSGQISSMEDLKSALKKEGYFEVEEHMAGDFTKKQLRKVFRAAKRSGAEGLSARSA